MSKFIDLFCGIGGFHQALKNVIPTSECVFACDIDKDCQEVYEENYGLKPEGDILKVDISKIPLFNILCAGFPCFVEGTKVLTNIGYKNIEDVILEDKLLTHIGNFQNILNLQRKVYNGDLYEIKIKYHFEIITCTEEHPFYVREKIRIWDNKLRKYNYIYDEPKWKKANELTMDDYFGMVINTNKIIPEFTFNKKINKYRIDQITIKLDKLEYWYMMGYFIGDGWIEKIMYKITFSINNKDEKEILKKIQKILPITDKKFNSEKM